MTTTIEAIAALPSPLRDKISEIARLILDTADHDATIDFCDTAILTADAIMLALDLCPIHKTALEICDDDQLTECADLRD